MGALHARCVENESPVYRVLVGLTCDGLRMPSTLPTSDEDDIPLTGSDIVALQEKEFVDTVILKGCNLDDGPNRAGEALLDY